MRAGKGFTLIELMIVVAILAICAAIAIPAITGIDVSSSSSQKKSTRADYRGDMVFYTDPETGCQYVRAASGDTLTPRMNGQGQQICHSN